MKRVIVTIGLVLALAAPVLPAEADDRPDFKLKCRNGRYDAKVWLSPFKVENKCADRLTSQWVEVVFQQIDEDIYIYNVASGVTYMPNQSMTPDEKVYVRLGTGVFCYADADLHYVDTNGITTVYPKGTTWRATCPPDGRGYNVVVAQASWGAGPVERYPTAGGTGRPLFRTSGRRGGEGRAGTSAVPTLAPRGGRSRGVRL